MKKRILAIICIMFLLFTATSPLSGGFFSYADETQQEQLSQDEVIKAAIALYLNERKAWIVNQTGDSIDTVQAVMQSWINSYDFWTNHTNIGSAAEFYANCIIKYNPFRISLKGPAVRALNDLYDWLVSTGKLGNLESDNTGGQTSDNLYNGSLNGNSLYYNVYGDLSASGNQFRGIVSNVYVGTAWNGNTFDVIKDYYCNANSISIDFNSPTTSNNSYGSSKDYTVTYPADNASGSQKTYTQSLTCLIAFSTSSTYYSISPRIHFGGQSAGTAYNAVYGNRGSVVRGNPCLMTVHPTSNPPYNAYGFITYDSANSKYYVVVYGKYSTNAAGSTTANVNLDTDNFNKTDPTPPEGDDEVTYTPEDKTTGNTYNTYNEYITNYVKKNTVVNNNSGGAGDEPETPGGTTPPWDNSSGAGTLTPDGNGGYNFNLPDLTLPDLDIDWSINGLKDKFPFSIPWDLMAFFTVLNAEPETPSIQADIDLGIVDWEIDWDFHNFDTLAALLRNLEFIGFCLALLLITRSIIKG